MITAEPEFRVRIPIMRQTIGPASFEVTGTRVAVSMALNAIAVIRQRPA